MAYKDLQSEVDVYGQQLADIQHGNLPSGITREQALANLQSGLSSAATRAINIQQTAERPAIATGTAPTPVTPTDATPASVYGTYYTKTPEEAEAERIRKEITAEYTGGLPDAEKIRTAQLTRFQSEIDALNAAAAAQKAEIAAQLAETGRRTTAQAGAIGARRGLLGSTFQAGVEQEIAGEVGKQTRSAQALIEAATQEKIAALRGEARKTSQEEYEKRLTAYREGRSAVLQYLQEAPKRREEAAKKAAISALDMDLDLAQRDDVATQLAREYGISKDAILSAYRAESRTRKETEKKAELERRKAEADILAKGRIDVSEGETAYQYNPETGKYEIIARGVTAQPTTRLEPELEATINFVSSAKKLTKDQANALRSSIQLKGIDGLKDWAYTSVLTGKQKEDFDKTDRATGSYELALAQLNNAKVGVGPWANLAEKAKPWAGLKKNPEYQNLFFSIEFGQASQRNALFGSALTPTESAKADAFLVNKNDDFDTIKMKLEKNIALSRFNNDAIIAKNLGLPKPNIDDYLNAPTTGGGTSGTITMTGPDGTFEVPEENVEVFKQNGYTKL